MAGEEKTKDVFGDYISIYNFKQSIDDGATVPLFYENRIPELQLTNENLNEDMENLLEEADLTEEQQQKLEREFAREYHLITRNDRLETIARDIMPISWDAAIAARRWWYASTKRLRFACMTKSRITGEKV